MSTELKTIEKINLISAVVETNIEEVSKSLDLILENYRGLIFTEETVKDCKNTLAELRKGKMGIDNFRKEIKKELTKNVTEFEGQIKELLKKVDEVIYPIEEQYVKFEEDRKNKQRERVQIFVNDCVREFGLNEVFSKELTIDDSYLNKTATDKKIKEDLESRANTIKIKQDKFFADVETIKTKVELANAKNNTNLVPDTYVSLLKYEEVESISEKIFVDAEKTIIKEEIKQITNEEISEETFTENYEVIGTEKQLDDLEEYMRSRGLIWKII